MNYLENYYANFDEEGRLASNHGQVEYLTTMKYIHEVAGIQNIKTHHGTALNLTVFEDESFDITLVLEPMYHMYTKDELNANFSDIKRIKIIAADGAANYMRECIDAMDESTFDLWMKYHFSICERMDLIGATDHSLDILQKQ